MKILFSIKKIILWFFYKVWISTTYKKAKVKLFVMSIALARKDIIWPITVLTMKFFIFKTGHSGMWKTSFDWTESNLTALWICRTTPILPFYWSNRKCYLLCLRSSVQYCKQLYEDEGNYFYEKCIKSYNYRILGKCKKVYFNFY